ncbi:NapC/NirT family cytochrome c [Ferrimonas senticii]|uniref:NapC/NirT family cytochrome c n=1 Tax=Ferrimonas senticii TaxID=394566 RepID=UPI00041ECCC4|nr:NapC/NirT family cytochrome c [Ferrimonas senticii]
MAEQNNGVWSKPRAWWRFGVPIGGLLAFVVGALAWVGFDYSLHWSSTNEFCTSCHNSPSAWVWEEYQQTPHYNTASGIAATCHDCHIPNEFFPKLWVKGTSALKHVSHQILDPYQDKAEFEQNRLRLAEQVWAAYRKDDSKNCRSCHDVNQWDMAKQSETAAQFHQVLYEEEHPTCIDCHKGIAHHLPQQW